MRINLRFSNLTRNLNGKWLPHLGTVPLEIELEDRTLEVDVPPLEAAFIKLFSEKRNFSFLVFWCIGSS